ncbi:terminase [Staphylococcus sp. IVB6227]|uniref:terminase n=1 Tax=Staphylococcus sp. IVB6227 TaxID=2989768 RepID=UPI0021CE7E0A|nr:terminase [Staphylococcus sp. IVB6227]UXR79057.1 terminase [Staphylococcus sp. IVB6227]
MAEYKVSAKLDASTQKFKSKLKAAINAVKRYKKEADKIKDPKLGANNEKLKRTIKESKRQLNVFSKEKAIAKLDAKATKLESELNYYKQLLKEFDNKHVDAEVDADIDDAKRKIKAIETALVKVNRKRASIELRGEDSQLRRIINITKAKLESINRTKAKAKLEVDSGVANAKVRIFKQVLRSIPNKIRVRFDVDKINNLKNTLTNVWHDGGRALGEFSDKMDHLAGRIRSFGTVFGQQIKGVLIASFQALIPIIAGLVPVIMAVGNALKVATGGAIALAGSIGIAAGGFVAFGAMGISAIKMLNDGTLEVTKQTERYHKALDNLKDAWSDIIKQNQSQIFNSLANGLSVVETSMRKLMPFFSGISDGIEKASKSLLNWANTSKVAEKFFNMMNTTGVSVFNRLLSAAGGFGDGLINVFTQLAPLFQWSANWLDRLSQSFSKWAKSAEGQNSIKQFMEYTKTNLPIIGNIFKNTFAGINNLLKAFEGNSTNIFKALEDMSSKFKKWSENISKSDGFKKFIEYVQENGPIIMELIGNIVRILVAFGTAMAPIASALLKLISKIAEFTASLLENHPNVARFFGILGILGGAFWALLAPIMFISSVLTNVFGKSLFDVGKHVFKFIKNSSLLRGAFDLLKSPLSKLTQIFPILGSALAGISAPVLIVIGVIAALVGIVVWLWKTNEDFRNAVIAAWETIRDTVGGAIQGLIGWLQNLWSKIQETLQPIMPVLQKLGEIVNQVLGVIFIAAINGLVTMITGLWTAVQIAFTAIGTIISSVIQLVVGIFTAFIQFLSGDFSGAWQTLQTTISNVGGTIWQGLVSIWNQIQQFLFDTYSRITGQTVSSWSQIWQSIVSYVTNIWNSVVQWFSQVVSTIGAKMGAALVQIIAKGAQWVSSIQQAMINFLNAVVQGFLNVVRACVDGMQNALNSIRNFIGQFIQAGVDLVMGLVNGVKQAASNLVEAVSGVVGSAIDRAKSLLRINSPSKVFAGMGGSIIEGFVKGVDSGRGSAVNSTQRLARSIIDSFDVSAINDITSGLGSVNSNVNAQIQHTHRIQTEPNQRVVRIEMDVNNDALTNIVNGRNASNNSVFYF